MITLERSQDWALLKSIITHHKVYPFVSDDYSPAPENYEPIKAESVTHVLVRDGEEVLGVWIFIPQNAICWEVHTCLLPNAYGERAIKAAQMMAKWIWENTTCLRLVTNVPEYNRKALRFAKAAGMTEYGRNPDSYMKTQILHDQILLGMSKPCQ